MAAGDRERLFSLTDVRDIKEQLNDPSTGLVTKVDQLETNPIYTLAKDYDPAFSYPSGYPILRNGRIEYSNKATSGTYKAADFDAFTRSDTDPLNINDDTNSLNISSLAWGVDGLVLTGEDGTNTRKFKFNIETGRFGMLNASAIADSNDTDAAMIKDVPANRDRFSWNAAKGRLNQVELSTEVPDLNSMMTLQDVLGFSVSKVTSSATDLDTNDVAASVNDDAVTFSASCGGNSSQFSFSPVENRFNQPVAPTDIASENGDMLTKKDGDALYRGVDDYPVGELFTLGVLVWDVGNTTARSSVSAIGFKYSNPTLTASQHVDTTSSLDYNTTNISNYLPTLKAGHACKLIFVNAHGTERDNREFATHDMQLTGEQAEIRVYSGDNGTWSSNDQIIDEQDVFVEIKCIIE